MKKIRLLIAIIAVSLCPMQSAWAERVAPTEPTVTLTDSGEYYLYNVGYDNAVHYKESELSVATLKRRKKSEG